MHNKSGQHGEYKMLGGKLIIADLVVSNGRLCSVELSGDFFLDPEETLVRMMAAVEGISAGTPTQELAARLRGATEGAVLLGVTPKGAAVAIRRAVEAGKDAYDERETGGW